MKFVPVLLSLNLEPLSAGHLRGGGLVLACPSEHLVGAKREHEGRGVSQTLCKFGCVWGWHGEVH